jgi:DNA-binding NarL/FixJ family response regulator
VAAGKNSLTVLLAADESVFKNLLWQRLLKHFSRVERVGSLAEYLSLSKTLLERRTPFLAVVDLLMPTQDGKGYLGGLEILEESHTRFPEVRVLLTTDLLDPRMDDLARSKGAAAILKKPELARLQVGQLESAIDAFGDEICAEIDRLAPPLEEEVATFLRDLGAEQVSDGFRVRDQLSLLKGLMGELANPQESSEISLLVLRLASEYFERAVLFLVKRDEIVGLGGFGDTGDHENMIQKVRRLRIPVGAGSSLDDVLASRSSLQRSQADAKDVDRDFHDAIGAYTPRTFVYVPMVSRGRVIAALYADNAVTNAAIPDISGMEIFMAQAGLAMEKALLERQLLTMKKGLRTPGGA